MIDLMVSGMLKGLKVYKGVKRNGRQVNQIRS